MPTETETATPPAEKAAEDAGKKKQDKQQIKLDKEREQLLDRIVGSFELENWGKLPLTLRLNAQLAEMIESEEKEMHSQVDNGEKPVSGAVQERYRGRRSGIEAVRSLIEFAGRSTAEELGKARQFEEHQANELGAFYKPPAWGDQWHEEARKRAEKKFKTK
jgi:hypothetical protein